MSISSNADKVVFFKALDYNKAEQTDQIRVLKDHTIMEKSYKIERIRNKIVVKWVWANDKSNQIESWLCWKIKLNHQKYSQRRYKEMLNHHKLKEQQTIIWRFQNLPWDEI